MWLATFVDYHAMLHHVNWIRALVIGLLGTLYSLGDRPSARAAGFPSPRLPFGIRNL